MAIFANKTEEQKVKKAGRKATVRESALAARILTRPRVTEKAYSLNALNQYVFVVEPRATKGAVKKSVEEAYEVHVTKVRMIHLPKKKRLAGRNRQLGFKKGVKKAVVCSSGPPFRAE